LRLVVFKVALGIFIITRGHFSSRFSWSLEADKYLPPVPSMVLEVFFIYFSIKGVAERGYDS
jgi:hypothetical protein